MDISALPASRGREFKRAIDDGSEFLGDEQFRQIFRARNIRFFAGSSGSAAFSCGEMGIDDRPPSQKLMNGQMGVVAG